jgi:precorrin-2 dehydrogenase/sirohydrochlorin ferrochelatase
MKPYPIFLTGLHNRHCIVIGGTHEAEGKVRGLLAVDATITVISPELNETLNEWADEGWFTWLKRSFQSGDLRGAFLVIAERSDPETNTLIWNEAEAEGILVNVMDDVDHCNFVAGSVVRQGPLVLTISTSGAAPALSVRLRQRFQEEFGKEYAIFLTWMQALRPHMATTYPSFQERKRRYYALVDSDVLHMIKNGRLAESKACVEEITGIPLFSHDKELPSRV